MENVREKIRDIRLLLNDDNLNTAREELLEEVDHLEAIISYLEKKNNSLRNKIEALLRDVKSDIDGELEEIGDILY